MLAALESGVDSFESSFGELGGCPVPRGATGNIATEDLVSMLHEMGVETGIDLERLLGCARQAQEVLGRPLSGHLLTAGPVDWHRGARAARLWSRCRLPTLAFKWSVSIAEARDAEGTLAVVARGACRHRGRRTLVVCAALVAALVALMALRDDSARDRG